MEKEINFFDVCFDFDIVVIFECFFGVKIMDVWVCKEEVEDEEN